MQSTDRLMKNTTIYAKFIEMPETFWARVGKFFRKWWWTFAVGFAVIIAVVVIVAIQVQTKKGIEL